VWRGANMMSPWPIRAGAMNWACWPRRWSDFRDKLQASDAAEQERKAVQAEQARVVQELSKAMVALADGDLTAVIHMPFDESYEQLRLDYNRTVANLSTTVGSVVTVPSASANALWR
jgi:Methyl-accepting chemotaxis protein